MFIIYSLLLKVFLARNTSQLPLKLKIPHQETIYPPDKIILRKRKNSFDDNFTYEYKGPTNFYIHQFLVDLKRRKNKSLFRCFKNENFFQLREKCDSLLKRKLPVSLVEAKGPLALNFDCIFLFLIMMGAALYFALKIEVIIFLKNFNQLRPLKFLLAEIMKRFMKQYIAREHY